MNIAIVIPRFGEQIVGGAETLARSLAAYTVQQGWQVTVLTTCATDSLTWENSLPTGTTISNGVTIHRFAISAWHSEQHHLYNYELYTHFTIPTADQYEWLSTGVHSQELYQYIDGNKDDYDFIFALPYISTIIQYAAWVAPEKTILIPCLHNESHAFMAPLRLLMTQVQGLLFLTPEEKLFALNSLGVAHKNIEVLGVGIDKKPQNLPPVTLPSVPYILVASRLESGKNLALLYEYAQRYVDEGGELKLCIIGSGPFIPPEHPAFNLCGFVAHEEKLAYAQSALALCQPSLMESFSIVIMESWQMGRPVLVHKDCAVTTGHVKRSAGGFAFASYKEFANAIDWLQSNPKEAAEMGNRGKRYVNENYQWSIIFEKLNIFLSQIEIKK